MVGRGSRAGNTLSSSTGGVLAVFEESPTSAASGSGGLETDFRSFGVSAPGQDIVSTVPGEGPYHEYPGTSMALSGFQKGFGDGKQFVPVKLDF